MDIVGGDISFVDVAVLDIASHVTAYLYCISHFYCLCFPDRHFLFC